jgi:hypothetical protein
MKVEKPPATKYCFNIKDIFKSINLVRLSLSLCHAYLSRSEKEGGERQQTQQEQVEGRHGKQFTSSLKSKQKIVYIFCDLIAANTLY